MNKLRASIILFPERVKARNSGYDLVAFIRGKDDKSNRVQIYLKKSDNGDFYDVGTANPARKTAFTKKNPLWERTPNVQSSTDDPHALNRAEADDEKGKREGETVKPETRDSETKNPSRREGEQSADPEKGGTKIFQGDAS